MALGLFAILFQAVFPYIFPLQPQNVLDEALHALCAGPFHLVGYMSINVQGKGCGRVAQVALDCFYIISSPDGCDSVTVPQIMEADIRTPDGGHDLLEVFVDGTDREVVAHIIRKDQPGIFPYGSSL